MKYDDSVKFYLKKIVQNVDLQISWLKSLAHTFSPEKEWSEYSIE